MHPTFSATEIDSYVEQIVMSVFASMLQVEVMASPGAEWSPSEKLYVAAVSIHGKEPLRVLLYLSLEQALWLAPRLMPIAPPSEMDEDVRDAMREVINMIGGNLKGVLAPHSELSIATVLMDGEDVPDGELVSRSAFEGECGVFWVALRTMEQPALTGKN